MQFTLKRLMLAVACLAGALASAKFLLSDPSAEHLAGIGLLIFLTAGLPVLAVGLLCRTDFALAVLIGSAVGFAAVIAAGFSAMAFVLWVVLLGIG